MILFKIICKYNNNLLMKIKFNIFDGYKQIFLNVR